MRSIIRLRVLLLLGLVALLAVGAAACGGDDSTTGDAAGTATDTTGDGAAPDAPDEVGASIVVDVGEQNGSGMSGAAMLTEIGGGQIEVVVALEGDDGSSARPFMSTRARAPSSEMSSTG